MEPHVSLAENSQDFTHRSVTGDSEKLSEVFENEIPRLFRMADCILHNSYDSEDALQDGLLSAMLHIDQFKGNAQFSSWLYSIVRNSALTKLRRQKAHPSISMDDQSSDGDFEIFTAEVPTDSGPDPERACEQSELAGRFARTLECLPEHYRAIILLCDFEGFTGKEAAERLGLTVSALKSQRNRARSAIRDSMGDYFSSR
jgi:RNA polymerase sigma-70 factor (ECF subfamily)